ncbi:MAG: OmpP1/FadL family transporter [Candidatus Aminicenantia bacterium]
MKKPFILASLLIFSVSLFGNGLNLNSIGSKALSMGGAFIALANDFSAIYWNPAGITQFDSPYFGFYLTDVIPTGNYALTLAKVDTSFTKHYISGMAGFYRPLTEKLFAGVGIYVPSGLGSKWKGDELKNLTGGKSLEWMSRIGVITFSPVFAYKFSDKISVGGTLNINYGMMELKTSAKSDQYSDDATGWGFGATFGLLLKPADFLSLGFTFKTASKVSFEGTAEMLALKAYSYLGVPTESELERDITWPIWIGGGIAFKPMEKLTLTADVQWTKWSDIDFVKTDYKSTYWKTLFAYTPEKEEDLYFYWKDATQIRFGLEYLLKENIALRAGFYHDPSPAPDDTMNILLPIFTNNVITVGLGYKSENLNFDFGFEYLMGKERDVAPSLHNMPGNYKMKIIVPTISIGYKL